MARYHVKKDGAVGICSAKVNSCPLGGKDEHIVASNEVAANVENMKRMELLYAQSMISLKKSTSFWETKEWAALDTVDRVKLGTFEMQKLIDNRELPIEIIDSALDQLEVEGIKFMKEIETNKSESFKEKAMRAIYTPEMQFKFFERDDLTEDEFKQLTDGLSFTDVRDQDSISSLINNSNFDKFAAEANSQDKKTIRHKIKENKISIAEALSYSVSDDKGIREAIFKEIKVNADVFVKNPYNLYKMGIINSANVNAKVNLINDYPAGLGYAYESALLNLPRENNEPVFVAIARKTRNESIINTIYQSEPDNIIKEMFENNPSMDRSLIAGFGTNGVNYNLTPEKRNMISEAASKNPNLDPQAYDYLVMSGNGTVLKNLINNNGVDKIILEKIAGDEDATNGIKTAALKRLKEL